MNNVVIFICLFEFVFYINFIWINFCDDRLYRILNLINVVLEILREGLNKLPNSVSSFLDDLDFGHCQKKSYFFGLLEKMSICEK